MFKSFLAPLDIIGHKDHFRWNGLNVIDPSAFVHDSTNFLEDDMEWFHRISNPYIIHWEPHHVSPWVVDPSDAGPSVVNITVNSLHI